MELKPTPEQKMIINHLHGHAVVKAGPVCAKTSTLALRAKHLIERGCGKTEMRLTREQIKIIDHKTGPAFVVAGPGTGKTETLCQRIMDLVDKGCPPKRI